MKKPSVFVVDDDKVFRDYVALVLQDRGYAVEGLENGRQLVERLVSAEEPPLMILLDVVLPDGDGIEVIKKARAIGLNVPIIMLSGVGHVRTVVEAMKLGAADFLMKPFDEIELETAVKDGISRTPRTQGVEAGTPDDGERVGGFVTRNPGMRRLAGIIRRVAPTDVAVLIAGESGVGKEVLARYAHTHSGRRDRPFVKVNCAAMPAQLLESELFGYERGAFTGAATDKPGKFEMAHTGTLLLDEIGEMSPLLQAKLLHVLQDGTFSRLGGRKTISVDARIIAATNIDIESAVSEGKFREDLYFRLNVIRIDVPPLRERREDIPELCNHFIQKYRDHYKSDARALSPELMNRFVEHDWPGNVRELENCIRRFLVLPEHYSVLLEPRTKTELPTVAYSAGVGTSQPAGLLDVASAASDRAQKELVGRVLHETNGNRKLAAKRMNICYKALLNKLKRWNAAKESAA